MKPVMKCERCGEEFKQTRPSKRFCGSSCKYLAWADKHPRTYVKYYGSGHPKTYCIACGVEFVRKYEQQVCCTQKCWRANGEAGKPMA